jgi:hypothetical protein
MDTTTVAMLVVGVVLAVAVVVWRIKSRSPSVTLGPNSTDLTFASPTPATPQPTVTTTGTRTMVVGNVSQIQDPALRQLVENALSVREHGAAGHQPQTFTNITVQGAEISDPAVRQKVEAALESVLEDLKKRDQR